jgi:acyl-CoA synthetase (NDP forming)
MIYNNLSFTLEAERSPVAIQLDKLFHPDSIAIVGASNDPGKAGGRFLKGLIDTGYQGALYPINPAGGVIQGINSCRSVSEMPGDIDLAILTVPARAVPSVILECSQRKVEFAIVHSAGFSELGPEGKELEQQMLANARLGNLRIVGPNCMGVFVPQSRINTIVYGFGVWDPGHIAFIGQSGWVTENVVVLGKERGLRFSKIISIGNQSDLAIEDILEYLTEDDDTHAIAFYAEGLKRGRDFLEIVKKAAAKKPVIVWKAGRSAIGARSAASHTGSLAGNHAIFDALAIQTGMTIVRDLDDLMDMMVGFSCPVLPRGNRISVLCESGGGAVASADTADKLGLTVPTLSSASQQKLVEILTGKIPPFATPRNPVDIVWGPADNPGALFEGCGRVMLAETDSALMLDYQKFNDIFATQLARLRDEVRKPIFLVPGYVTFARSGMAVMTANGVPTFHTPARALNVLAELVRYSNRMMNRTSQ